MTSSRQIGIIAFTQRGCELAQRLSEGLGELDAFAECGFRVHGPQRFADGCSVLAYSSLASWTTEHFASDEALVFVGATGIAVRAIAPHVRDKFSDPAVVSVDEAGRFAVPLLSGHVGGANELARAIAVLAGGEAVVSTATDVNGLFAVDEWAARRGLRIAERSLAKLVSSRLLEGAPVGFYSDFQMERPFPETPCEGVPEVGFAVTLDETCSPFDWTLHLVPRIAVVGVGCRRGTDAQVLARAVDAALVQAHVSPRAVAALASIDVKCDEQAIAQLATERGWKLRFYSAEELAAVPGEFSASDFVRKTVGVDNVCERAALAGGGKLVLGKQAGDGVTVAIALLPWNPEAMQGGTWRMPHNGADGAKDPIEGEAGAFPAAFQTQGNSELPDCHSDAGRGEDKAMEDMHGKLVVVGLGPGGADDMSARARRAVAECDVLVGYTVYVDLVRGEFPDKEVLTTPMRKEVERCRMALEAAAAGRNVAMVCSGDPGVYGMAGLVLELAPEFPDVEVSVVPGVSASNGGAAVLGAPLMHDYCVISLSDLLTPWEKIEQRLAAAAQADFCISLYNPSSHKRADYLQRACDILLQHKSAETVCGTVRNIGREGQEARVLTLGELRDTQVDMFTCVFIGNSQTLEIGGKMVTPRGYLQRED